MIAFWAFVIWLIVWLVKQNKWSEKKDYPKQHNARQDNVQDVEVIRK